MYFAVVGVAISKHGGADALLAFLWSNDGRRCRWSRAGMMRAEVVGCRHRGVVHDSGKPEGVHRGCALCVAVMDARPLAMCRR